MPLLLPPPVPVDQLAEVGRLLTVFDDELVFEELLGRGTLQEEDRAETEPLTSPVRKCFIYENIYLFIYNILLFVRTICYFCR